MKKWLVVCPIILSPTRTAEARAKWDIDGPDLLLIDNTTSGAYYQLANQHRYNYYGQHGNIGVAKSWNVGIELAMSQERDGIVFLSSSVILYDGLRAAVDTIMHEADLWGCLTDFGWHMIGFRMRVFSEIGRFDDEAYWSYYEDSDFMYRMKLGGIHDDGVHALPKVYPPGECENAAALKAGVVSVDMGEAALAYMTKWGGSPGFEVFKTPYNVPGTWIGWIKTISHA